MGGLAPAEALWSMNTFPDRKVRDEKREVLAMLMRMLFVLAGMGLLRKLDYAFRLAHRRRGAPGPAGTGA
jgi:hypothetical protein